MGKSELIAGEKVVFIAESVRSAVMVLGLWRLGKEGGS